MVNRAENVEFLEITGGAQKNSFWRSVLAAAMAFSLCSLPAEARPAIEVLNDTARCAATYDAARKAAELSGHKPTVERLAIEQDNWRTLLATLAQLIRINGDLGVVSDIRRNMTQVYEEQFKLIMRSVATNDRLVLPRMHDRCKKLADEIQNALDPPGN